MTSSDQCVRSTHFTIVGAHVTFNTPRAWKPAVGAIRATEQAQHAENTPLSHAAALLSLTHLGYSNSAAL